MDVTWPIQAFLFFLVLLSFNEHFNIASYSLGKNLERPLEPVKLTSDDVPALLAQRVAYALHDTTAVQLASALDEKDADTSFMYLLDMIRSGHAQDSALLPSLLMRIQKTIEILSSNKLTIHHQLVLFAAASIKYRDTLALELVLQKLLDWKSELPVDTDQDFPHTCRWIIDLAREIGDLEAKALVKTKFEHYVNF